MRDTAAAQSVLFKDALPNVESALTDEKVLLTDLSTATAYTLASVYLKCPLLAGQVQVAIKETPLPVSGVQMLLGNDLAGELVVPTLKVSDTPLPASSVDNPLYPSCAVTRSQSKLKTPSSTQALETSLECLNRKSITKEELVRAQQDDPTSSKIRNSAVETKDLTTLPCFYYQGDVLLRAYRLPQMKHLDSWAEYHQIVVPHSVRSSLISLAHDGLSGHLGITKTY